MRRRDVMRLSCAAAAVVLLAPACGSSGGPPRRAFTVFAAASLTDAFTALARRYEAAHPPAKVAFNFAASSSLAAQLRAGAPADVVATADEAIMARLVAEGLAESPEVFAKNRLALVVAEGNPKAIRSLRDLARPGLTFVACAVEVPCGALGGRVLHHAGVTAPPQSYEANVKAVVSRVLLGEADAGIVYVSDVRRPPAGTTGIEIREFNPTTSYPIAAVAASPEAAQAGAFISFVLSQEGQRVLSAAGFAGR
ncbi:MAG: molybdate ABC transporter substrate-binding protein [Actinobacteria bacterium]|nr:molybdate ABC transporter substrate-binding protein [Actinomycetota bacterium]